MLKITLVPIAFFLSLTNVHAMQARVGARFVSGTNAGIVVQDEINGVAVVHFDNYGDNKYNVESSKMVSAVKEWRGFKAFDQVKVNDHLGTIREVFADGHILVYLHSYKKAYLFDNPKLSLTPNQPEFDLVELHNLTDRANTVLTAEEAKAVAADILLQNDAVDVKLSYGVFSRLTPVVGSERMYDPVLERNIDRLFTERLEDTYTNADITMKADGIESFLTMNLVGKKVSHISATVRVPHGQVRSCVADLTLTKGPRSARRPVIREG